MISFHFQTKLVQVGIMYLAYIYFKVVYVKLLLDSSEQKSVQNF